MNVGGFGFEDPVVQAVAAAAVAKDVGRPKREVYALAVGLNDETGEQP